MAKPQRRKNAHPLDPPSPQRSEQVPAGDDSDINEGRDLDPKDVDRKIAPPDADDRRDESR